MSILRVRIVLRFIECRGFKEITRKDYSVSGYSPSIIKLKMKTSILNG